jgi:hypothetical protein
VRVTLSQSDVFEGGGVNVSIRRRSRLEVNIEPTSNDEPDRRIRGIFVVLYPPEIIANLRKRVPPGLLVLQFNDDEMSGGSVVTEQVDPGRVSAAGELARPKLQIVAKLVEASDVGCEDVFELALAADTYRSPGVRLRLDSLHLDNLRRGLCF